MSFARASLIIWLAVSGAWSQSPPPSEGGQTAPPTAPATPPIDPNAPEITTKEAPALFKTRVDMVAVPVVVRDSKGRAIGTFTKENFQVFDRGAPQEIVRFVVEKSGDFTAKAAKTVDAIPTEGQPAPATVDVPERFVAYLFDDVHLPYENLARARDAASRQLSTLPKTDRAAIFTTSGQNQVDFTDEIDKLQADLLLLRNRSISSPSAAAQCPEISYYMADQIVNKNNSTAIEYANEETFACLGFSTMGPPSERQVAAAKAQSIAQQVLNLGQHETQVTWAVLKEVVRRMSAMPGQRIVVLISPGFLSLDEYQQDKGDVIDRAIRAKVVINGLDARGLWMDPVIDASQPNGAVNQGFLMLKQQYDHLNAQAQNDILAEMAYGTGGSFFANNNDLFQGMQQVAGAPEYYYILGFSPQMLKLDGSFHVLKVTLKTTPPVKVDIQARKGYYSPKKASTAEETAKGEIEEALFSRDELIDAAVELRTQYFKSSDKDATIAVLCRVDPRHVEFRKADGRNLNVLTVVSAVFDHNGDFLSGIQKTVDIKMKDTTMAKLIAAGAMTIKTSFSVPPGSYIVRLVVRDAEGQLMSALNSAVAIQ